MRNFKSFPNQKFMQPTDANAPCACSLQKQLHTKNIHSSSRESKACSAPTCGLTVLQRGGRSGQVGEALTERTAKWRCTHVIIGTRNTELKSQRAAACLFWRSWCSTDAIKVTQAHANSFFSDVAHKSQELKNCFLIVLSIISLFATK